MYFTDYQRNNDDFSLHLDRHAGTFRAVRAFLGCFSPSRRVNPDFLKEMSIEIIRSLYTNHCFSYFLSRSKPINPINASGCIVPREWTEHEDLGLTLYFKLYKKLYNNQLKNISAIGSHADIYYSDVWKVLKFKWVYIYLCRL